MKMTNLEMEIAKESAILRSITMITKKIILTIINNTNRIKMNTTIKWKNKIKLTKISTINRTNFNNLLNLYLLKNLPTNWEERLLVNSNLMKDLKLISVLVTFLIPKSILWKNRMSRIRIVMKEDFRRN